MGMVENVLVEHGAKGFKSGGVYFPRPKPKGLQGVNCHRKANVFEGMIQGSVSLVDK